MNSEKKFLLILVFNFLILVFLSLLSYRFLNEQLRKTGEVDPEIMAQYTTTLEVDRYLNLVKKIKGYTP